MAIPTEEECMEILRAEKIPENIILHCRAVKEFTIRIAEHIKKTFPEIRIDMELLIAASLLHDISRAEDGDHIINGTEKLRKLGLPEVATVAKTHGLYHLPGSSLRQLNRKYCFMQTRGLLSIHWLRLMKDSTIWKKDILIQMPREENMNTITSESLRKN